ncbi:MAG: hypothetical protein ACLT98_11750 [Eggerthellaceae bacterium]
MVFQNVYLFNDTVENNIKFGMPNATHADVEVAARRPPPRVHHAAARRATTRCSRRAAPAPGGSASASHRAPSEGCAHRHLGRGHDWSILRTSTS